MSNEYYLNNPLIHRDRRLGRRPSSWVNQFDCSHIRPLIICRGPIRKEAIDVFREMGINHIGILLSEKDSIVYQNALAPELRVMSDPDRIHRVPDYTGANKEERNQRIQQIIGITRENDYNAVFAGYGFMAEDETMVAAMEAAGLNFIGPCSRTVHDAGLKDEAKRTALKTGVSVTPGIDNGTALTLLKKHKDLTGLRSVIADHALPIDPASLSDDLPTAADQVLAASYEKGIDLYTVDELSETLVEAVERMSQQYPKNRVRLKAISGGGGKGQRILGIGEAAKTPELVREVLNEVKTTGVGDNKNVLVELNIETTRHQEIQVIGNGDWCMTLGGRDCSLQMHEQKLLEVSVTVESLERSVEEAQAQGKQGELAVLEQDLKTLVAMEEEASRFGAAVGLDSVSTFECIVDRDQHFFMEMNTRIQVEQRVSELCYALQFTTPENKDDCVVVETLVEGMVLLAAHGPKLPKPERIKRFNDSVEARLNATNQALQPNAGGVIEYWSDQGEGEIRDDQGISLHNPDTDVFMKYALAGAYDSNIALLLTVGESRLNTYQKMAELIRQTEMRGKDLATNIEFHYGLVNWFIGNNINARPTTRFIVPYLTAVGELRQQAASVDLEYAWQAIKERESQAVSAEDRQALVETLELKHSLILRPMEKLFSQPHLLSGWLSVHRDSYTVLNGRVSWNENPISLLVELYHFLNLDYVEGGAAAEMIWSHDHELLESATAFYESVHAHLPADDWVSLCSLLDDPVEPEDVNLAGAIWAEIRAAHRGFQSGCSILALLPAIGEQTNFASLHVNEDLSITIPERLLDQELQDRMAKVLVHPQVAKSDELVAASGGMFYGRESPEANAYVQKGQHFSAGDPLYIVEVMKMFNKVYAPFSGTVDEVLVDTDGVIIAKGQPVFKVTPDERVIEESPEQRSARRKAATESYLALL